MAKPKTKNDAPRTMTLAGLRFLQALAAQRRSGCFLEVGPLFGSSTNAIAAGRSEEHADIHTIDTFEAAPWVRERLGLDLSRTAFDRFTSDIENLTVHQGFAPDIVQNTWSKKIGFYFDDATHGNPGWTNNYDFFSQYFTEDAIVCGDDFAGGWPDIVQNVYKITEAKGLKLFVIGRVWAFTESHDHRISHAIHDAFPKLKSFDLEVQHDEKTRRNIAASWTWGLHKPEAIKEASLFAPTGFEIKVDIERQDGTQSKVLLGKEPWRPEGAKTMEFTIPSDYSVQFCVKTGGGKTQNTRDLRSGAQLDLSPGDVITSMRLSHQ